MGAEAARNGHWKPQRIYAASSGSIARVGCRLTEASEEPCLTEREPP